MPRGNKPIDNQDPITSFPDPDYIFTSARFKGYLGGRSMKIMDGQLVFSIIVPREHMHDAYTLWALTQNPLPLDISIELDQPYQKDMEDDEARILHLLGEEDD